VWRHSYSKPEPEYLDIAELANDQHRYAGLVLTLDSKINRSLTASARHSYLPVGVAAHSAWDFASGQSPTFTDEARTTICLWCGLPWAFRLLAGLSNPPISVILIRRVRPRLWGVNMADALCHDRAHCFPPSSARSDDPTAAATNAAGTLILSYTTVTGRSSTMACLGPVKC
jgi:hypothetical protein